MPTPAPTGIRAGEDDGGAGTGNLPGAFAVAFAAQLVFDVTLSPNTARVIGTEIAQWRHFRRPKSVMRLAFTLNRNE